VAALAIAAAPLSADADRFSTYNIRVLDRITEIAAADLNGDGLEDLLVLHTKGRSPDIERWISVFWHKPGGGYSSAADITWRLPDEVAALDTGDVTAEPGAEILALTATGASIVTYSFDGAQPGIEPLAGGVSGAILPSEERVPVIDFSQDWSGDGRDDLAIPGSNELYLFVSAGDTIPAFPQVCGLETRVAVSVDRGENGPRFGEVNVTRRLPQLAPVDLEGDGDNDLVVHWEDQVRFYLQEDGRFSSSPDAKARLNLISSGDREENDYRLEVSVLDVDGDGLADLFGGKSLGRGIGDFSSTVALRFGDGALNFGGEPDWSVTVEGISAGNWIDLDGDGGVELILPVVSLGITDLVRILITKKVKVGYNFYFPAGGRDISQDPDFTKEVTLEVGLEEGGHAQIVDFKGDYNGDGRKDLAVATGAMELSVFLGKEPSKGELFDRKPVEKIEVDTFGEFRPLDLNGDGRLDMILHYSGFPEKSSRAAILLNTGEW
jgi:hypothetical protein